MNNEVKEQSKVVSEIIQEADELEQRWKILLSSIKMHEQLMNGRLESEQLLESALVPYKIRLVQLEKVIKSNLIYLEHAKDNYRFTEIQNNSSQMNNLFEIWNSMKFENYLDEEFKNKTTEELLRHLIITLSQSELNALVKQLQEKSSSISIKSINNLYIMGAKHN